MNREDIIRIRLKVITTTGINILCTALKNQKVSEWLPHFQQAYRQVKQDQRDDQHSKQQFIKTIKIKKGEFYVANSEVIGDVFQDNDQVICEMLFPKNKKQNKAHKRQAKATDKLDGHTTINNHKQSSSSEEDQQLQDMQKPKKIVKEDILVNKRKPEKQVQNQDLINETISSIHQIVKGLNTVNNKASPKESKKKNSKQSTAAQIKRSELLQKVDLIKLKRLIVKPNQVQKNSSIPKTSQQKSKPDHESGLKISQ